VNLNLVTSVDGSGYGIVGLNVLKALERADHPVTLFPRHAKPVARDDLNLADFALLTRCGRRQRTMDMTAPCLRISTEMDMTLFAGRGPRGGLSFFETTRFTEIELRHLASLDVLFVTSEWGRSVAIDNGIDPDAVAVMPLGVDRAIFYDVPLDGGGPTVFVNVGKWEYRKGQDVLLEAFGRAFSPGDAVELRLRSHNPWSAADDSRWMELCKRSPMTDHITALPRTPSQSGVADMMRAADCGVFPARAEGWNLGALEMLSCGRHVIATGYSATTEYLDRSNALLIDVDELEPAADPVWMPVYTQHKTGDWARLGDDQLDQLVDHLRTVHERKQAGTLGINEAGIRTAQRFPWERTAQNIVQAFER
jgi:glycosyltransferase involved in cell wall biosynthesis